MAELDIRESQKVQGTSTTADNVMEGNFTRVYPYRMVNADKEKAFIKPNAVSIITISNNESEFDEKDTKLFTDENGNVYFNLVATVDVDGGLFSTTSTSTLDQQYKEIPQFTGITNMWEETNAEKPAVFFINKPYDKDEFESGKQIAYIAPSLQFSAPEVYDELNVMVDEETMHKWAEISFIDIATLEDQYTNSKIMLVENLLNNNTIDDGTGNKVSGIEVEFESHSLINFIKAKGTTTAADGTKIKDNIDFNINQTLMPIKATPVSTNQNLSVYMDWFDYDVSLPLFAAKKFIEANGDTLESLKTITVGGKTFIGDDEVNLISDAIAYSYAFATKFVDFPRYTADEIKALGSTSAKPGDFKGEYTIGIAKQHSVVSIAGTDPQKIIDGLYETYIRKHPNKEDSMEYRVIKELTAALSRYIYSMYAVGNGENSFNQILLPWYLVPAEGIVLTEVNKNFVLSSTIKFKLQSEYFDVSSKNLTNKSNVDISEIRMIQTDRKLTLPQIDDVITEINKIPLPGDINTKSSNDLRYVFYSPIESSVEIDKVFLNNPTVTTNNQNSVKTIETGWTQYGEELGSQANKEQMIKDYMQTAYTGNTYTIKTFGIEKNELSNTPTSVSSLIKKAHTYQEWKSEKPYEFSLLDPAFLAKHNITQTDVEAEWNANGREVTNTSPDWLKDGAKEAVAKAIGLDVNTFEITSYGTTGLLEFSGGHDHWVIGVYSGYGTNNSGDITVALKRFKLTDVKVEVSGTSVTINTDRDVIFDREKWKNFFYNFLNINRVTNSIKLISKYPTVDTRIDELIIGQIFGEYVLVHIGSQTIRVPLIHESDETIGIEKILFI